MSEPIKPKIAALEGLRGLMAVWVVLGHVSLTFGWRLPGIDQNTLAVDVFILLSGFVIARLIDQKQEPYAPYILRRAFRLFPLYLAVLAVSTALLGVQGEAWERVQALSPANLGRSGLVDMARAHLPLHLATHLPLAQGIVPSSLLPRAAYTLVGQAWSISLEWQFYLLAPFMVWAVKARQRWLLLGAAVALLLLAAPLFSKAYLGAKILHFVVGGASYFALERRFDKWAMGVLAAACLGVVLMDGAPQLIVLAIWLCVIAAVGGRLPLAGPSIDRLLSSAPLKRLGEISYSIYLVHMIPLYGVIVILGRMGVPAAQLGAWAAPLTLVLTYLIATATYRFIERPGIDLGAAVTRGWARKASSGSRGSAPAHQAP